MTDLQNDGGAVTPPAGGQGSDSNTPPAGPETVSKADHQRALADMHRFKENNRALQVKLDTVTSQVEELNSRLLSSNKDFETLFNQEKEKRVAAESQTTKLKESVIFSERHKAVYPALKKAGFRDDAENLLEVMDLGSIDVEATSNGRFLCSGVETFIELAKTKYPYAFQKPPGVVVNGGTGNGAPAAGSWNPNKLYDLEKQCKKKGDMTPYKAAVAEWIKQGRPIT